MIFVLDASAMIAYLRDEPAAAVVAEALLNTQSQCYAHALNLCEVFYDFHRSSGQQEALQAISDLAQVGVIEDANLDAVVWQAAGRLKANLRRVSLADCFAIELAARLKATILRRIITNLMFLPSSLNMRSGLFADQPRAPWAWVTASLFHEHSASRPT